jgi:hypothetical protein
MRIKVSFLLILLVVLMSGCSNSNDAQFNDDDVKIKLIHSDSNDDYNSYSIEVMNEGQVEMRSVNFFLYYPIIQPNGSKGNPFKVEGKPDNGKPVNLKPGEKVVYSVIAPIKEVFGDSKLLDFKDPQIELNGLVKQGKNEIPFGMSGGYIHK